MAAYILSIFLSKTYSLFQTRRISRTYIWIYIFILYIFFIYIYLYYIYINIYIYFIYFLYIYIFILYIYVYYIYFFFFFTYNIYIYFLQNLGEKTPKSVIKSVHILQFYIIKQGENHQRSIIQLSFYPIVKIILKRRKSKTILFNE